MDFLKEVVFVSDSANQNANCTIHDLATGALITSFKGGNSVEKGLALIGDDCMISAVANKPKFKVWTLSKQYPEDYTMDAPAPVEVLAVSNCGTYCIAGIESTVFIWEISSGILINGLQYHAKRVSCLRFSSDGSHIISGGKDGIVFVWLISEVVSATENTDNTKPRFTWNDHATEVTDIFVGSLGIYGRVATASRDMTCRIYELESGFLLTTVCVDYAITSVVMDECQYFLFLGSAEGDINRINLFSVSEPELHYDSSEKKSSYLGHSGEITGLSISAAGKFLASGSKDNEVRIWEISNFTCVRKIPCSGPVTNVFISLMPPGLKEEETRFIPRLAALKKFQLGYRSDESNSEWVNSRIRSRNLSLFHLGAADDYFDSKVLNSTSESLEAMMRNQLSLEDMSRINLQIFSTALSESVILEEESPASPAEDDEDEESESD